MRCIPSAHRWSLGAILIAANPLGVLGQQSPGQPPEIKNTVEAFAGFWELTGSDTEPGNLPAAVQATMDCKPAALGFAVNCLIAANISTTHIEAVTLIGYSPDERVVRWMEISSSDEYHDHRGPWKGHNIDFEPLSYEASGVKLTEHLTIGFPAAGMMTFRAITETSGGKARLELTGTRTHPSTR